MLGIILQRYGGSAAHEKLTGRVTETVDEAMSENSMAARLDDSPQVQRDARHRHPHAGNLSPAQSGEKMKQKLKKIKVGGKSGIAGKADKLKESIRRHYHNAFTDVNKQDAINIFLGMYQPYTGRGAAVWDKHKSALQARIRSFEATKPGEFHPHLWELPALKGTLHTDYYLHNTAVTRPRRACEMYSYNPGQWWLAPIASYRSAFVPSNDAVRARRGSNASDHDIPETALVPLDHPSGLTLKGVQTLTHRAFPGSRSPLSSIQCLQTPGPPMPHSRLLRSLRSPAQLGKKGRLIRFNRLWRPRHGGTFKTGPVITQFDNGSEDYKFLRTHEVCDIPRLTEFDDLLQEQHLKEFVSFDPCIGVPGDGAAGEYGFRRTKTASLNEHEPPQSRTPSVLQRNASLVRGLSSHSMSTDGSNFVAGTGFGTPKDRRRFRERGADSFFLLSNERLYHRSSGSTSGAREGSAAARDDARERANMERLVAATTAPTPQKDKNKYESYLRMEESTLKQVDEFHQRKLVGRIRKIYGDARKVFKGLANSSNTPIATIQASLGRDRKRGLSKHNGGDRSPSRRGGANPSLIVATTTDGVSILGQDQHARAARRRRRNGRRSASDRQRRRDGSMLLVEASYLNKVFSIPPPQQFVAGSLSLLLSPRRNLVACTSFK